MTHRDLRALRLNRGLSIVDAAKQMGVEPVVLHRAERGISKPRPGNALAIASFFDREVTDIWPVGEEVPA